MVDFLCCNRWFAVTQFIISRFDCTTTKVLEAFWHLPQILLGHLEVMDIHLLPNKKGQKCLDRLVHVMIHFNIAIIHYSWPGDILAGHYFDQLRKHEKAVFTSGICKWLHELCKSSGHDFTALANLVHKDQDWFVGTSTRSSLVTTKLQLAQKCHCHIQKHNWNGNASSGRKSKMKNERTPQVLNSQQVSSPQARLVGCEFIAFGICSSCFVLRSQIFLIMQYRLFYLSNTQKYHIREAWACPLYTMVFVRSS